MDISRLIFYRGANHFPYGGFRHVLTFRVDRRTIGVEVIGAAAAGVVALIWRKT